MATLKNSLRVRRTTSLREGDQAVLYRLFRLGWILRDDVPIPKDAPCECDSA